jgi:hypothetical protein
MPVVLALPGISLGVSGLFHPHHLAADTAERWYVLHLVGLLVFPLVGVALMALVRGRGDLLAWVVRLTAFVYATFYTALDVIYGVAAGDVTRQMGADYQRSADFTAMLQVGVHLGEVGSWSLLACGVALLVDQLVPRPALSALPALALPVGAWLVHVGHIFAPTGVVGMLLIGCATGLLAWNLPQTRGVSNATFGRLRAS